MTAFGRIREVNSGRFMHPEHSRLIGLLVAMTVVGAFVACFMESFLAAKSFAFGGSIVLMSALFLVWRFQQGRRNKKANAQWYLRQAYRTAIERFVWAAGMLVVGFKLLEFEPLWMLAGFLGGQVVWLAAPIWMRVESVK